MKRVDILIVDDEKRYADMLARRLTLRGMRCDVCYDGASALEALGALSALAVILDLRLPDIYGTEVLKRIKDSQPQSTVIILTGHGTENDRRQCMALGASAFMNKPLDIDRLMKIMATIEKRQV